MAMQKANGVLVKLSYRQGFATGDKGKMILSGNVDQLHNALLTFIACIDRFVGVNGYLLCHYLSAQCASDTTN